ncbi:hypothetical protein [Acidocella sp.]|uniref:hypothetical protein n=1 Tax=Acidocella sp. TaxID=50710 RepID=UPI0026202A74|nr:hypothetical protein [Acidocella sp.]
MQSNFVALVSRRESDALVRLQAMPIIAGLNELGMKAHLISNAIDFGFEGSNCVIFHYHDDVAISRVRALRPLKNDVISVCLAADIYSFEPYIRILDIVDVFLVPTYLHKSVLSAQISKPIYVFDEGIDISLIKGQRFGYISNKSKKNIFWFGYPESFHKSMASLEPVLWRAKEEKAIQSFDIFTKQNGLLAGGKK